MCFVNSCNSFPESSTTSDGRLYRKAWKPKRCDERKRKPKHHRLRIGPWILQHFHANRNFRRKARKIFPQHLKNRWNIRNNAREQHCELQYTQYDLLHGVVDDGNSICKTMLHGTSIQSQPVFRKRKRSETPQSRFWKTKNMHSCDSTWFFMKLDLLQVLKGWWRATKERRKNLMLIYKEKVWKSLKY